MCVAAIAWAAHPDWLLVAIGNRDEYHLRPAAPLARWDNGIIAGRDLKSGGTWLGLTEAGRFALVTNRRGFGDADSGKVSRGELVSDQLLSMGRYGNSATAALDDFNPFNLIVADRAQAHFLSNRPGPIRTSLPHGIYGLSNGALDEPWPKTLQLKAALTDWLNAEMADQAPLFAALASEKLGDIGLHTTTPSDVPLEAPETPPFIRNAIYGTRCSTVVIVDQLGRGTIRERRFDSRGEPTGETSLTFAWAV
ncbi:MAG: NRDE family protein [Novosphingobium sp.]